jgi:hypothetical protein
MFEKLKAKRRLLIFGGASILVHAVALSYYLDRPQQTASLPEISVEFDTPEKLATEKPVERKRIVVHKTPVQPLISSVPGSPGKSARRFVSKRAPSPSQALQAILASDFEVMRATISAPVSFASYTTSKSEGLEGVDPKVHLSDGTIDKLVAEGRGYADTGRKRKRRGIRAGMGGGGSCK